MQVIISISTRLDYGLSSTVSVNELRGEEKN
jgi:hypothetical protein